MALREDTSIYPLLIELASCLCQQMGALDGPELCYCGVVTGPVSLDFCGGGCDGDGCGGQAWVRLIEAFPSSTFPTADGIMSNCNSPWAYAVEIGVARCAPQGEVSAVNGYTPPLLAEQVESLRLQTADLAALRRAIQCCFGKTDRDYMIGAYTQTDVNGGGCVGGVISLFVREDF